MHFSRSCKGKTMKYTKYYLLALFVIIIDQAVKLTVHETMPLGRPGEIVLLGDWLKLHYTLNNGMAFGIQLDWMYGKLTLTLFRWVAMFGIGYYIFTLIRNAKTHRGFIWCMGLILGGAIGNVVDSTFYGVFIEGNAVPLDTPPPFYPWFHGRVIDMFYFDIWQGFLPNWIPIMGGNYYSFWPIFNVADASIFIGVFITIFRSKAFFPEESQNTQEIEVAMDEAASDISSEANNNSTDPQLPA